VLTADVHFTAGLVTHEAGKAAFVMASLDRNVYSVAVDGKGRWRVRLSAPVYALAALEAGQVAAGDDAGIVTLLDAAGRKLWQQELGSRVTALAGPWQEGLLAGGWDDRLTMLNTSPSAERVRWSAELGSPVSDVMFLPGAAVVSTLDGSIRAFDRGGEELWRVEAGSAVTRLGPFAARDPGVVPALLAGVQDGRLLALAQDGSIAWQVGVGTGAAGSPVWFSGSLAEGAEPMVVAGTGGSSPMVVALSARGDWLWRAAASSPVGGITASDLDGDGTAEIVVGLASGQILALDGSGRVLGQAQAALPVWHVVAQPGEGQGPGAGQGGSLVLANVLALYLTSEQGPAGRPRFSPPVMLPVPTAPMKTTTPPATPAASGPAAAVASQPASDSPGTEGAVLAFLGDVVLGRSVELQLARYGSDYVWSGLASLLGRADLAVANLEGGLSTTGHPVNKPYQIRAHPRWGQALLDGGLDVVSLANNHTLDFQTAGLDETLRTLGALRVTVVGAGSSQAEARQPAVFSLNGVRVALLAYAGAYWNGSADVPATDRIAWADPDAVRSDVQAVRNQADVVVVVLHAGTEYAARPNATQIAIAHAAVEEGADLVVGHHPHVTQTVERYRGALIVYSLGNAVFDIPMARAMQGDLLSVRVTRDGLAEAALYPLWIDEMFRPRLLDDGTGGSRIEPIYP
jgi:poly-gamma-glutamate synthesis protein (capsule biosynthesis protein)